MTKIVESSNLYLNNYINDYFESGNQSIQVDFWENETNKYEWGLAIICSDQTDPAVNKLSSFLFNNPNGTDFRVCLSFDDSVSFINNFNKAYLEKFPNNRDNFLDKYYYSFLHVDYSGFFERIKNFSLTSKQKPSVVFEQLLDRPIDLLNKTTFENTLRSLPISIRKVLSEPLERERGLLHYSYAYSNRSHLFSFSLDGLRNTLNEQDLVHFDENYSDFQKNGVKGDALKAVLLAKIQKELSSENNTDAVNNKLAVIKNRYDYKLLGQSQDITTWALGFFGLGKTSSLEALDKWLDFSYPDLKSSTLINSI